MWRKIINNCKREREESLVYTKDSSELKEAIEYIVGFFDTFSNDEIDSITSDVFRWKDVPHWDSISLVNEGIEIKALKQYIQEILPLVEFKNSGNTIYMTIPTEDEINKEIKNV